ncbi:MAG: translation initiation factor IF-3 [Acidimicrobiales bacterium]
MVTAANTEPRINDRIRAREVRLVGPDGAQIGITPLPEALRMAQELELDLVEVADKANPPVCRIMDYGKYKYEAAQKAKESRKKSTNVVVKEMKYRPKIGVGDFDTKTKKVEHFLTEGHKVKVTIMFRGREMQHPDLGRKILDQVAEAVAEVAKVETYPRLDGRNMTMVLGPDKKAQAAAEKRRHADGSESPARSSSTQSVAIESDPSGAVVVEEVVVQPEAVPFEAAEPVALDEA